MRELTTIFQEIAPWLGMIIAFFLIIAALSRIWLEAYANALEASDHDAGPAEWADQLPGVFLRGTVEDDTDLETLQSGAAELPSPVPTIKTPTFLPGVVDRGILALAAAIVGGEGLFTIHMLIENAGAL